MDPRDSGRRRRRQRNEQPELPRHSPQRDATSGSQDDEPRKEHFLVKKEVVQDMIRNEGRRITRKKLLNIRFYFAYNNLNIPQRRFIQGVFNALNLHKNFIVQSSTGTGKTLSLLTSTLAWLDHAKGVYDMVYTRRRPCPNIIKNLLHVKYSHIIYTSKSHSQLSQIEKQLRKLPYRPKMVLFGSRKQLCINQVVKWNQQGNIEKNDAINGRCNVAVNYYYMYSNSKSEYIQIYKSLKTAIFQLILKGLQSVQQKLQGPQEKQYFACLKTIYELYFLDFDPNFDYYKIEQPPGNPENQQLQEKRKKMKSAIQKIKKIAQKLQQFKEKKFSWNQPKKSGSKNPLKMDQQPKQEEKKNQAKDHGFQDQRPDLFYVNKFIQIFLNFTSQANDQKKSIMNNMKKIFSMQSRCPYYFKRNENHGSTFFNRLNQTGGVPLNNDLLKFQAKKNKPPVCPYILPQRVGNAGDLYLMPYTYLLCETLLPLCENLVKDAILVFDEGHNVEQAACDGYSVKLCSKAIESAQNEVRKKVKGAKQQQINVDEDQRQKIMAEKMIGLDDLAQQQTDLAFDEFHYSNDQQRDLANSIFQQLKKEDLQRRKELHFRMYPHHRPNPGSQNNPPDPRIPKFQEKSNQKLKEQLQDRLHQIVNTVRKNMDAYFSRDKKPQGQEWKYSKALWIAQGWQQYLYYSTAQTNQVRTMIRRIMFDGPNSLPFDWTFEENLDQKNVLKFIVRKYKQSVDLKFARRQYNYKSMGMHHFFKKLYNVLYEQSHRKKYYLLLNQHKKIQKENKNQRIYKGQLHLKCLTAEFAFNSLMQLKPRSIIITSGTLKPMDKLKKSLGIQFLPELSAGSEINAVQNVHVRRVAIDLNGNDLIIKAETWNDDNFEQNFILTFELLIQLIQRIPNGILIIVSSYSLLAKIQERFLNDSGTIRKKFIEAKPSVWFEKKTTNFDALIKDYSKAAKSKNGGVIFCVCRAKLTEGIDFKDQLCRGVIFLGVPHLDPYSPELVEKQNYLKYINDKDWGKWKLIEVSKALNQAIGRVVRDKKDYGAVFLIDQRLCSKQSNTKPNNWEFYIKQNISDWIKEQWPQILDRRQFERQFKALKDFFDRKEIQSAQIRRDNMDDNDDDNGGDDYGGLDGPDDDENFLNPRYNQQIGKSESNTKVQTQSNSSIQTRTSELVKVVLNFERYLTKKAYIQSVKLNESIQKFTRPLNELLKQQGFRRYDITGDGNCLFRSVSQILYHNQNNFWEVKNRMIDTLSRSLKLIPKYIVNIIVNCVRFTGQTDQQKVQDCLKYFKKQQHGYYEQLLIMSCLFTCCFIVHTLGGTYPICYSPVELQKGIVIHLGLYQFPNDNFDHYFAIQPIDPNDLNIIALQNQKKNYLKSNPDFLGTKYAEKPKQSHPSTQQTIVVKQKLSSKDILSKKDSSYKDKRPKSLKSVSRRDSHPNIDEISTPVFRKTRSTPDITKNYKPITEEQRKKYQNKVIFSPEAKSLNLKNTTNGIDFENVFFQQNWQDLQFLSIENCGINNAQWRTIVKKSNLLNKLKVIEIGSNMITNVQEGDLESFRSLVEINFRIMKDVTPQTKQYLEKVKAGKNGKRKIVVYCAYEDTYQKK